MGTFYGGLAHVPIASLVMACELAGSYDLLVPLMLAEGIAFVALRNRSLYHAQVPTRRESPAHREDLIFDVLKGMRVGDVIVRDRPYTSFSSGPPASEVIAERGRVGVAGRLPGARRRREARRDHQLGRPAHDGGEPGPRRCSRSPTT